MRVSVHVEPDYFVHHVGEYPDSSLFRLWLCNIEQDSHAAEVSGSDVFAQSPPTLTSKRSPAVGEHDRGLNMPCTFGIHTFTGHERRWCSRLRNRGNTQRHSEGHGRLLSIHRQARNRCSLVRQQETPLKRRYSANRGGHSLERTLLRAGKGESPAAQGSTRSMAPLARRTPAHCRSATTPLGQSASEEGRQAHPRATLALAARSSPDYRRTKGEMDKV